MTLRSNTGTGKIQPFLVLGIFILTMTLFEANNPRAQPPTAKAAGLIWGRELKSSWRLARGNLAALRQLLRVAFNNIRVIPGPLQKHMYFCLYCVRVLAEQNVQGCVK